MIADSLTDWAGSCNKEGPITSFLSSTFGFMG